MDWDMLKWEHVRWKREEEESGSWPVCWLLSREKHLEPTNSYSWYRKKTKKMKKDRSSSSKIATIDLQHSHSLFWCWLVFQHIIRCFDGAECCLAAKSRDNPKQRTKENVIRECVLYPKKTYHMIVPSNVVVEHCQLSELVPWITRIT